MRYTVYRAQYSIASHYVHVHEHIHEQILPQVKFESTAHTLFETRICIHWKIHVHVHVYTHVHVCTVCTCTCTLYLERFVRSQVVSEVCIKLLFCLITAEVVESLTIPTHECTLYTLYVTYIVYMYMHVHVIHLYLSC